MLTSLASCVHAHISAYILPYRKIRLVVGVQYGFWHSLLASTICRTDERKRSDSRVSSVQTFPELKNR